jgi:outer membrane protein OmpA-like peptidoglycan-associated protein
VNQSGLRFLLVVAILFSFLATAFAQSSMQSDLKPSFDVYGGFSRYNPGGKASGVDFNHLNRGWSTAATVRFTPRYSLSTEFGSYSNSTVGSARTYLIGPNFIFHRGPFAPFGHFMVGAERISPKAQPTNLAFVEAFGGGLDVTVAHGWSVRFFQADLLYAVNHDSAQLNQNQFFGPRLSAGLIWNFGRKHRPVVAIEKTPKPSPTTTAAASPSPEPVVEKAPATVSATPAESSPAVAATPTLEPTAKPTEPSSVQQSAPQQSTAPTAPAVEEPKPEAVAEKPSEKAAVEKVEAEKSVAEKPIIAENAAPEKPVAERPVETSPKPADATAPPSVQHVGALIFPYDQYPTLLSPKDKRNLDAVVSRLKLEPNATAVILGSGDRYAPKSAAQRAVNSKYYLIKKGIAADRVKLFASPAQPRSKKLSPKTELVFVPAGAVFEEPSFTPVDEQKVKPEHLHVAHPEWHEK